MPLGAQLAAEYRNIDRIGKRRYRANHARQYDPNSISNIFDSSTYQDLIQRKVEVDGKQLPHRYFEDD